MTKMFGFCAEGDTEPLKDRKSGWGNVIRFVFAKIQMMAIWRLD